MHTARVAALVVLCAGTLVPSLAPAAKPPAAGRYLELYVRKPGSPADGSARDNVQRIDLESVPLEDARMVDVQYGASMRYRGIPLSLLVSRYGPPQSTDLAILHFKNGMIVPLPIRDEKLYKRLGLFIARGLQLDGADAPTTEFPSVGRKVENFADVRETRFEGNKLVVTERFHPMVPSMYEASFSPWPHVDSLVAIEFVNRAAYYAQLDVDPAQKDAHAGYELYAQSCQFCHGVRSLGATHGVDFVLPTPITTSKPSPRSLFFHVRYKAGSTLAPGTQMPALSHVSEDDARVLHQWLRLVAEKPLLPYAPAATAK